MSSEPPDLEPTVVPDPTYSYDLEALLKVSAPRGPADFASFWEDTYAEARAVPLRLTTRQVKSPRRSFEVHEVEFDAFGGVRIGGWLTRPMNGPIGYGLVIGHGYGGRNEPAYEDGAVVLAPCARGFNRSSCHDIPNDAARHVLHGIASRETYVHRGCVTDLWAAASALLDLHPEIAPRLHYAGTSFGGGIGALALPWDNRFCKAFLQVPSFGNHPLRLQLPCSGSGESVRQYHRLHPEVTEVLTYFDAATAARYITRPVLIAPALYDPAVPPPGQFAVHNGLAGTKELFIHQRGHAESHTEAREMRELLKRLDRWWRE